jgi:hypothetical protein
MPKRLGKTPVEVARAGEVAQEQHAKDCWGAPKRSRRAREITGLGWERLDLPRRRPGRHGTFVCHGQKRQRAAFARSPSMILAPRPGLEPGTCGLTVRRSTD